MDKIICLLSFIFIQTTLANLCDKPCTCTDKTADCTNLGLKIQPNDTLWNNTSEITLVKFHGNGFTHIRSFPQLPIEFLSFYNNSINSIDDGAFKFLSNLTTLDLSFNLLHSDELRPDIFKGQYSPGAYEPLKKLKTLRLSYNQLHTLHQDLFEHLPKLEALSIDHNPFKFIDRPTVIAISSIQNLKQLDLSNTKIKELPEYFLYSPRLLSVLNLAENRFTTVPQELENSHQLQTLILDDNPIKRIDHFPALAELEVLHINWMPELEGIGPNALSNLTNLKELMITHNMKLTEISGSALSRIPDDGSEGRVWPLIKRLYLRNNQLSYLEHNLLGQWDLLEATDLRANPWVCDCRNQWMVSVLIPKIKKMPAHQDEGIICYEPIEMRGISMDNLQAKHYHMRCLDAYGNRPERDGVLLIGVIIGLFIAIPFSMAALIVYRRRNVRPNQHFSRAFYKPADSTQYFVVS